MRHIIRSLLALLLSASVVFAQTPPPAPRHTAATQPELDQMLAPIALYPDSLLSQIFMAATYPLEVVEAARWSRANPDLKRSEEHTSELQSLRHLVCRLLLEKKKKKKQ